jgi:hypothetical protein
MQDHNDIPDAPACPFRWCTTNHSGAVFDPVHWSAAEVLETLGEHDPLLATQVRVQGSLIDDEYPPAKVHVDTRIGNADLWHPALILSPDQARRLSASVVLVAEIIAAP